MTYAVGFMIGCAIFLAWRLVRGEDPSVAQATTTLALVIVIAAHVLGAGR